jgi:hypothetical protein
MFARLGRRRAVVAVGGIVAALALGAAAFAYFTSTGSATGQTGVGSSSPWQVQVSAATGGPLYPGSGSENLAYTITNTDAGHQQLSSISTAVASDSSGNVLHNGVAVPGCLASWFTATDNPPAGLPLDLAGSGVANGSVTVTMTDANTSQNACAGVSPDITVQTPSAAVSGSFSAVAGQPMSYTMAPTGDSGAFGPGAYTSPSITYFDASGHDPATGPVVCSVSYDDTGTPGQYYLTVGADSSTHSCSWTMTINGTPPSFGATGTAAPNSDTDAGPTFVTGDHVAITVTVS